MEDYVYGRPVIYITVSGGFSIFIILNKPIVKGKQISNPGSAPDQGNIALHFLQQLAILQKVLFVFVDFY